MSPKFALSPEEIEVLIEEILPFSEVVDINEEVSGVCRDSEDDKFLSCAVSGTADMIITRDAGITALRSYRGIPIKTVSGLFLWLNKV